MKILEISFINDIELLKVGRAQYNAICNEDGGILDDFVIYNLSDCYMLVVNAANTEKIFNWLEKNLMDKTFDELQDRFSGIRTIKIFFISYLNQI